MAQREPDALAAKWRKFVAHVADGYRLAIDNYTNSLTVRDLLERAMREMDDGARQRLLDVVGPADSVFIQASRDDTEGLIRRFGHHNENWWWNRVPLKLGSLAGPHGIYRRGDPRIEGPEPSYRPVADTELEQALAEFEGLPLWGSARAADMQMFQFGDRVIWKGGRIQREVGEIGLHVECPWRIRSGRTIVVASSDLELPRSSMPLDADTFDPNQLGTTLRDERIDEFLAQGDRRVTGATMRTSFDLELQFEDGFVLELFADRSADDREPRECWRVLFFVAARGHIVMTTHGPETAGG